jgi:hypothetical protein
VEVNRECARITANTGRLFIESWAFAPNLRVFAVRLRFPVDTKLLAIPILLLFEIWQLVISERYLGVKIIGRDIDPRGLPLSERTACVWVLGIFATWGWMILLLFDRYSRAQGIGMIAVTLLGYSIRRSAGLKLVLVILTLEGALRVGMLLSLIGTAIIRARGRI